MSYDYSENILVQESAGHLLQNELGWEVAFAYNTEQLGENGSFGRKSYKEDPADPVFSGGSATPQPVDHSGPDG